MHFLFFNKHNTVKMVCPYLFITTLSSLSVT